MRRSETRKMEHETLVLRTVGVEVRCIPLGCSCSASTRRERRASSIRAHERTRFREVLLGRSSPVGSTRSTTRPTPCVRVMTRSYRGPIDSRNPVHVWDESSLSSPFHGSSFRQDVRLHPRERVTRQRTSTHLPRFDARFRWDGWRREGDALEDRVRCLSSFVPVRVPCQGRIPSDRQLREA